MNARRQIIDAMFVLLNKYPMDKITVDMIAKQCEMSRTSFYRYFQDKYQLMIMAYVYYVEKITEEDLRNRNWTAATEKILKLMVNNKSAFENMFKVGGQDSFSKALYANNLHLLREAYMRIREIKELSRHETRLMELYISGMVFLEKQWVRRNLDQSPEEMALIIMDAMPEKIKKVFVQ